MLAVIKVVGVSVNYGDMRALDEVSVDISQGEVVSILGPNGSGKTTLLKTIDGMLKPVVGSVYVNGKDARNYARRELAKLIGYVPQRADVLSQVTVVDFVLTGRRPYAEFNYNKTDVDKVLEALKTVNAEHLAYRKLDQLSGGELQRVIIARALAAEPRVLLLDEPTANLDPRYQVEILKLIRRLAEDKNMAAIMAIHDLTHAYRFSDKVIMLKNGKVVAAGSPSEVLTEESIERVFEVKAKVIRELKVAVIEP